MTGGSGFIGSHLAEYLLHSGHAVTVLDNFSNGDSKNITPLRKFKDFSLVPGSILDAKLVHSLVKRHDATFHLAAVVGVKYCIENPIELIHSNIFGTENVVSACSLYKKKLVLASTSEVYGKSQVLPFQEDGPRLFGSVKSDRWCYAVTKMLDEYLSLAYAREGLNVTILRYFNIYGPRSDQSEYSNVIPTFIRSALTNSLLEVHGTGQQTRSFTYVSDCVKATVAALDHSVDGTVLNIGNAHEISIAELAQTIIRLSGSRSGIVYVPYEDVFGPDHEDVPRRVPDMARSEQLLGYSPNIDLQRGLINTIEWFKTKQ